MDVQGQVVQILAAFGKGDDALRRQAWEEAVLRYGEATQALMALPASEPFDRLAFVASCLAGVAAGNVMLGNYTQGLQCADRALSFFDRSGEMYPVERGKWLLALLAKGIALAGSGATTEAEQCSRRARQMIAQSSANLNFKSQVDHLMETLDEALAGGYRAKKWWQAWK